jgi:hypothetical protein
MPQLSHAIDIPIARAGMPADTSLNKDVITRLAEDAAGAGAGTFMVPGTDPEAQAIVPTSALEITDGTGLGVVLLDVSKEPARDAAAIAAGNEWDQEDALPLQGVGRVWVRCDDVAVIVPNTPVFVRFVAGPGERLGNFRQDADTADAAALPNALFRSAHEDVDFDSAGTQRIALVEMLTRTV